MARTRQPQTAEDLVQATLLAALSACTVPREPLARAWLLGVMSHKIADHYRSKRRERTAAMPPVDPENPRASAPARGAFNTVGGWARLPGTLPEPDARASRQEQSAALRECIERLPPSLEQVFWLREVMGVPAEQVCAAAGITSANLWQRMHRARTALRECLESAAGVGSGGIAGGMGIESNHQRRGGEEQRR